MKCSSTSCFSRFHQISQRFALFVENLFLPESHLLKNYFRKWLNPKDSIRPSSWQGTEWARRILSPSSSSTEAYRYSLTDFVGLSKLCFGELVCSIWLMLPESPPRHICITPSKRRERKPLCREILHAVCDFAAVRVRVILATEQGVFSGQHNCKRSIVHT